MFALLAACMIAGGVFAQQPAKTEMPKERPTAEQMAQKMTDKMTTELGLNETQTKQVYQTNLDNIQQMEAHRGQMKAQRNATAEKMKSVLTTEQFVKWSQMQGQQGRHKGNMDCKGRKGDCQGQKCDGKMKQNVKNRK